MSRQRVKVGDWVRFYRAGVIVIGVVQYVRPNFPRTPDPVVQTDCGAISVDDVLECRRDSVLIAKTDD